MRYIRTSYASRYFSFAVFGHSSRQAGSSAYAQMYWVVAQRMFTLTARACLHVCKGPVYTYCKGPVHIHYCIVPTHSVPVSVKQHVAAWSGIFTSLPQWTCIGSMHNAPWFHFKERLCFKERFCFKVWFRSILLATVRYHYVSVLAWVYGYTVCVINRFRYMADREIHTHVLTFWFHYPLTM